MDPADYPRGSSYVCFDASPLIHYADAERIPELASWFAYGSCFTAQVVIEAEIPRGIAQHPSSQAILDAKWLQCAIVLEDDFEFIVTLRELWGSAGNRDYGEAEVVALCRRYGWTAIMNDARGRAAAKRHGVACVSTAGLLVGAVAEGMLGNDAGWELHRKIEGGFERPMILPTSDDYRAAFDRVVAAVKRWMRDNGATHWPATLAMSPAVDDVLARAVVAARSGSRRR